MLNDLLNTFITVIDAGNFSKAAEKLYLSSTALMKQMNVLEAQIGVPLLIRTNHRIQATDAGASFYHDARFLLQYSEKAVIRARQVANMRWHDIDFQEGFLHVRHTVTRQGGYGFIEGEPKTRRSKRQIILPDFVLQELTQHRASLEIARQKAGSSWQENDLVFPSREGKFLAAGTNLARFYKVLASAGIPKMRIHDLRHNVGTLLMGMGIYPKVVQEILGHSDVSITLSLYGHAVPGMHSTAMNKWEGFLQNDNSDKHEEV